LSVDIGVIGFPFIGSIFFLRGDTIVTIEISHSILWLFAISTLIFIIGEGIARQVWKTAKFTLPVREVLQFSVLVAIVAAALIGLSVFQHFDLKGVIFFVGAAFLPFLLTRALMPASINGLIVLAAVIAVKAFGGDSLLLGNELYMLLGLLVFKTFENIFVSQKLRFDDIAAPVVWLAESLWYASSNFDPQIAAQVERVNYERNVLLVGISIAYLVKLIKQFAGPKDKFFLKSLALSGAAGLALYLVLEKILVTVNPAHLALFYAAGTFAAGLLNAPRDEGEEASKLDYSVQFLVLIGILTLVATRLFGNFGLLLVASSCLSAYFAGSALIASLFFAARALFQVFEVNYNPNVTGINLMHSYVGASQYAGILLTLLTALVLFRQQAVWCRGLMFLALSLLVGPLSNYFLHEEPTGGFLLSILSSAIIIAGLSPAIFRGASTKSLDTLLLLPLFTIASALVSAPLIAMGQDSSLHDRTLAAAWVAGAIALLALFAQIIGKSKDVRPPAKVVNEG
jgi:hypothetical protein